MGKGRIKVGDEVAITATVRRRVTEDRVSVSIPSYGFPHSIVDKTSTVKKGQHIELTGDVTHIDGDLVTVNLGCKCTWRAMASSPGRLALWLEKCASILRPKVFAVPYPQARGSWFPIEDHCTANVVSEHRRIGDELDCAP